MDIVGSSRVLFFHTKEFYVACVIVEVPEITQTKKTFNWINDEMWKDLLAKIKDLIETNIINFWFDFEEKFSVGENVNVVLKHDLQTSSNSRFQFKFTNPLEKNVNRVLSCNLKWNGTKGSKFSKKLSSSGEDFEGFSDESSTEVVSSSGSSENKKKANETPKKVGNESNRLTRQSTKAEKTKNFKTNDCPETPKCGNDDEEIFDSPEKTPRLAKSKRTLKQKTDTIFEKEAVACTPKKIKNLEHKFECLGKNKMNELEKSRLKKERESFNKKPLFEKPEYPKVCEEKREGTIKLDHPLKLPSGQPPKKVEHLSLKDMSLDELLGTFEEFKSLLDQIFNDHTRFIHVYDYKGINHCFIMDLTDREVELRMMERLCEIYEPKLNWASRYASHYANALMPEWLLQIFMKKFSFTREAAIQHLKDQREYENHLESDEDFFANFKGFI